MAKRKQLICKCCKNLVDREKLIEATKYKRVCPDCYEKIKTEAKEYKDLIDYICRGFNQNAPTGQQLRNIKNFKEMGYSYSQIQYIIYYITCVEGRTLRNGSIGLVPYYALKAKKHYEDCVKAQESAKQVAINTESVVVTSNVDESSRINKTRLIDITTLV